MPPTLQASCHRDRTWVGAWPGGRQDSGAFAPQGPASASLSPGPSPALRLVAGTVGTVLNVSAGECVGDPTATPCNTSGHLGDDGTDPRVGQAVLKKREDVEHCRGHDCSADRSEHRHHPAPHSEGDDMSLSRRQGNRQGKVRRPAQHHHEDSTQTSSGHSDPETQVHSHCELLSGPLLLSELWSPARKKV